MLTQEDYWMIKELNKRGLYRMEIADRLGVHPKMVTRALKQGDAPSRRRRRQKHAKLKPYFGLVGELLATGIYNAVVIYREIQAPVLPDSGGTYRRGETAMDRSSLCNCLASRCNTPLVSKGLAASTLPINCSKSCRFSGPSIFDRITHSIP